MKVPNRQMADSSLKKTYTLGLIAAALTATAGLIELVVGSNSWTGDKSQPTILGLLTVLLAAVMGTAAMFVRRSRATEQSLAIAAGLAVPALVAFTTAGRFAIPGSIIGLIAGAGAFADAKQRGSLRHSISDAWPTALVVVLAVIYLAFGAVAGPVGVLGVIGAAAALTALALQHRSKRLAVGVLVVGVIPFAAAVWWSVVIPLTAILLLAIELPEILTNRQPPPIVQPRT